MSAAPHLTAKISPNDQDPESLFLGDAVAHLTQGRLGSAIRHPGIAVPLALAACSGLWFQPALVLALLGGGAVALLAASLAYLFAYAGFARTNRQHATLCPRCASRMWQFCCARCREPVPPLAFLSRGALLARCPHCGYGLSARRGALLAWCSTCSHTVANPRHFYSRPTHVVVMAAGRLPGADEIPPPWQLQSAPAPARRALYLPPDDHSACLLFIVDHGKDGPPRFDPWVIEHTRLLLVSDDALEAVAAAYRAAFPSATFERTARGRAEGEAP